MLGTSSSPHQSNSTKENAVYRVVISELATNCPERTFHIRMASENVHWAVVTN
jgi:hypothetical protein